MTDNGRGREQVHRRSGNGACGSGQAGRRRIHPRERTGRPKRNNAAMVSTVVAVALPATSTTWVRAVGGQQVGIDRCPTHSQQHLGVAAGAEHLGTDASRCSDLSSFGDRAAPAPLPSRSTRRAAASPARSRANRSSVSVPSARMRRVQRVRRRTAETDRARRTGDRGSGHWGPDGGSLRAGAAAEP